MPKAPHPKPSKERCADPAAPAKPIVPAWPLQRDVAKYFGKIETGADGMPTARWESSSLHTISLPYPMRLSWDHDVIVTRLRCHNAIARDLGNILGEIHQHYGRDIAKIREARMDLYGGCYNYRRMRGGHEISMHGYGIAIDLDPERNGLGKAWKADSGMMPEAVVDIFLRHGWTWGGLWSRPDAMHFQATRSAD